MPADSPENWQQIADTIKETLGGRVTGEGVQVRCPCHDDKTASLSIRVSADGLLWHCKANCDGKEIVKALQRQGLYPGRKKRAKVNGHRQIEDVYNYPGGVQKVRYVGKDFVIRKIDADSPGGFCYKTPLKDWKRQLYLLPWLEQAIANDAVILLCEGEKDVKNFSQLKIPGYFATTNIEGGGFWRREYTAQLKGARIVICEDNDSTGRDRTLKIGADLESKCAVRVWRFGEFGEHGDLSDYLGKYPPASREELDTVIQTLTVPFQINDYADAKKAPDPGLSREPEQPQPSAAVEVITQSPEDEKEPTKKRIPNATREDYYDLFERVLGPLPRDIFGGACMVKEDRLWVPAVNSLPKVKSEAHVMETCRVRKYNMQMVENHFFAYQDAKEKILIPEIPTWDGIDHIRELCNRVELDGTQPGFTADTFYQYVCYWLSGVLLKLRDPGYQNPVLILKGPQGIGKDWFIDVLTAGFEQWSKDLTLTYNDKDNYTQLSKAAVLKISEFDRTSRTDISTLKDMIFRKYTHLRPSHKPEFKDEQCRASFAATVNIDDIYRDSTGNRRYIVFNLMRINYDWTLPMEFSKQLLAQAAILAKANIKPNKENAGAMAEFLLDKTPTGIEQVIAEHWAAEIEKWLESEAPAYLSESEKAQLNADKYAIAERKWITNEEAIKHGIIDKMCRSFGTKPNILRNLLKSSGLDNRVRIDGILARGYRLKLWPDAVTGSNLDLSQKITASDNGDKSVTDLIQTVKLVFGEESKELIDTVTDVTDDLNI